MSPIVPQLELTLVITHFSHTLFTASSHNLLINTNKEFCLYCMLSGHGYRDNELCDLILSIVRQLCLRTW